jgi:Kdo2-lipid IVA lauroyltransferase/acyltransferase
MASLLRLIGALPLSWLHAIGALLGRLAYRFHARTRTRQHANFALAAPALSVQKSTEEIPWVWRNDWSTIAPQVLVDPQSLATIKAPGATIFLTPHLGCFEVAGHCVGHERDFTVMYRKPRIASLDAIMRAGREKGRVVCVPADTSGVRTMFKALKRGEAIGILPDQTPAAGEGAWVLLFGKPAYTMTLIAALAAKTDARLVMVVAERLTPASKNAPRFKVRAYTLPTLPTAQLDDEHAPTRKLNEYVEAAIAQCPTQYLWSYNRYKQPGGAPPAPPENLSNS